MNELFGILLITVFGISCGNEKAKETDKPVSLPITGTWKLLSGTLIEKGDTLVTDYTQNKSFIKIINDTHFAFFMHDLNKGKDTANTAYSSGGGRYSLNGNTYTEQLEYCTAREWEGNDFTFTVTINNDTLIQQGIEKIESEGINRMNIEKYILLNKLSPQ
jgi:hypothetical protein